MENINFVNMHRYQAIERVVYQKVKEWKPKIIVELGHGSGALTSAMGLALKEIDNGGKIYSYDINGTTDYVLGSMSQSALKNIEERITYLGLRPDRADVIIHASKIYLKCMKKSVIKKNG